MGKRRSKSIFRKKIVVTVILLVFLVILIVIAGILFVVLKDRKCLITQY